MKTLLASVPFGLGFALASFGAYETDPVKWIPGVALMLVGLGLLWLWADDIENTNNNEREEENV